MGIELERHKDVLKRLDRLEKMIVELLARDLCKANLPYGVSIEEYGDKWRNSARAISLRN